MIVLMIIPDGNDLHTPMITILIYHFINEVLIKEYFITLCKTLNMHKALSIINHEGKQIMFANFSGLKEAEIIEAIENSKDVMIASKINHMMLDVSNTTTTKAIKQKSTEVVKAVEEKIGKIYSAMFGLRLAQQIIANLIIKDTHFTSGKEEAMKWLAKKG